MRSHEYEVILFICRSLLRYFLIIDPVEGTTQCLGHITTQPSGINITCPEENYRLVFHDEFEGSALDRSKWRTKGGAPPPFDRTLWQGCKRELQIYLDENFTVEDGLLKITAKAEPFIYQFVTQDTIKCEDEILFLPGDEFRQEFEFTSGKIEAQDWFAVMPQDNFIMELRCKVPKGIGLWPAFWMWNHDEIDVFEYFGTEEGCNTGGSKHFRSAYISSSDGVPCSQKHTFNHDLTEGFHIYAVEVTEWYIKWFFDGQLIRTAPRFYFSNSVPATVNCGAQLPAGIYIENSQYLNLQENRYFRPIVNLAIHPDCSPEEVTGIPATLEIDYLRVYKRMAENDGENLCFYQIEGADILCYGQEQYFQLNSNGAPQEIIWSTSPNLRIMGQENSGLRVLAVSTEGETGWIQASIPGIRMYCPDSVVTFQVETIVSFSGIIASEGQQPLRSVNFVSQNFSHIILNNTTIERWESRGGSGYASYFPGDNEFHVYTPDNGFFHFKVYGTAEGCGAVAREFIFINYSRSHSISPNPATSEIRIKTTAQEYNIPFTNEAGISEIYNISPSIKGIRIYSAPSGISFIENNYYSAVPEVILEVNDLASGNYWIEVLRKDDRKNLYSFIKP